MSPIPVILLRPNSRSCSTSAPDPYAHLLSQPSSSSRSSPSYAPYFVPVLDTEFVDEEGLQEIIREGPERWGGVVVTSQRAVEAWERAGEVVEGEGAVAGAATKKGKGKAREVEGRHLGFFRLRRRRPKLTARVLSHPAPSSSLASSWASLPIFSIGASTTNSLLSLPPFVRPPAELIFSPSNAGNTPSLADLIASHLHSSPSSLPSKPLLYLTGDKNSPLLSQLLLAASPPITLVPHQTYLTSPLPSFIPTFTSLLASVFKAESPCPSRERDCVPWVVLFSPSAVELAMPVLRSAGEGADALSRVRFAVIGPTTGEALRKELDMDGALEGTEVVEAARPGAGGLVEVLRRRDRLM